MMGTLGHAVSDPNSRGRQRLQICFLNFWEGLETKEQPRGWYVFEYRSILDAEVQGSFPGKQHSMHIVTH